MAVLRNLSGRASLTFATTHYPEVKEEAERHPLFANAAVAFDVETLKPLYRCGAQMHLTVRVEEKNLQHSSIHPFCASFQVNTLCLLHRGPCGSVQSTEGHACVDS